MKVLQISKFYPPAWGGIETVVYELVMGFNRLNIYSDVLCCNTENQTITEVVNDKNKIIRCASWGKILSTSISPAFIWQVFRIKNNYEIIYVHQPDPMAALALFICRPKAKIVLHWHSDVVNQKKALKFYQPLQDWLLKRSDKIIATSQNYADSSEALQAYKNKVVVIPNGISFPPRADEQSVQVIKNKYENKKIIFSLGRMTYYKGFNVLIEASKKISDDSIILIGGSGELLDEYKNKIIAENLQNKVIFLGNIKFQDLAAYFQACDVFCLPSIARSEAFGMVLIEAMSYSKPIVATNIKGSGVPWVNQHNETGLNVKPNNPEELANAINILINSDYLCEKMGKAANNRYKTHFTSEKMVKDVNILYKNFK